MKKADLSHYLGRGNFLWIRYHQFMRVLKGPGYTLEISTKPYRTHPGCWRTSRILADPDINKVVAKAQEIRRGNSCYVECWAVAGKAYFKWDETKAAALAAGLGDDFICDHQMTLEQYLESRNVNTTDQGGEGSGTAGTGQPANGVA